VRRERLQRSLLYLVTDTPDPVERALAGGVDVVQLRAKDASDDEVVELGRVFRRLADAAGALFVVNDRTDLAVACDADGVHVGQGDVPVAEARAVVGPDRLVGLSTHAAEQIEAAEGADYLGVGPVYATPTKAEATAVGVDLVRAAARLARVPWFAIGGIDASTLPEVVEAGARRVAVVRAIRDAPDPAEAARSLRALLEGL
jgi:thiamine-phosphate pyrophosphorylase